MKNPPRTPLPDLFSSQLLTMALSRRSLLAKTGVLGLVISGKADAALAHLQDNGQPLQPNPTGDQQLNLVGPIVLESLDPAFARDLETMFLVRQIFGGLTRLDDELMPVLNLASDVSLSENGLRYIFTLEDAARFYSGRHITANDVVFSLQRALDPATANGDRAQLAAPTFISDIQGAEALLAGEASSLEGVTAVDDFTIQIQLNEPDATFLMRLAAAPAAIVDSEDLSLGPDWWRNPNASGAFAVQNIVDNDRIELVPNSHYVTGQPVLDQVNVRIGSNAFGGIPLYEQDKIDVSGVDLFNIERVLDPSNSLSAELLQSPLFATEYVAFRTDVEPLSDVNIRRALLQGYPRHKIADVSFNARVSAAEGLVPDGMLGRDHWEVSGADFDLQAAQQLIAESSYGAAENVPPIELYAATPERAESLRDFVKANLGLQIDVYSVEWGDFLDDLADQRYPAYLLYWGADYPDPESFLRTLFGSASADNYVGYANESFDELLQQAAVELDIETRAGLYAQANQLLTDDAVILPFFYDVAYTLVKPWVKNVQLTPLGILSLADVWIER